MERIRKENWIDHSPFTHILGVEMQNGNKYYLVPNAEGFVPVNLKKQVEMSYSDTDNLETGLRQSLPGNKKVFKFNSMEEVIAWATS